MMGRLPLPEIPKLGSLEAHGDKNYEKFNKKVRL
jgi:hypothetical protein